MGGEMNKPLVSILGIIMGYSFGAVIALLSGATFVTWWPLVLVISAYCCIVLALG